jgi:fatty-acid desaturase
VIAAAVLLYCVAGMLGIGMCYHRLLTHRGTRRTGRSSISDLVPTR